MHEFGSLDSIRVFLHILGASVWVGGQIVLGGLVPTARSLGEDAPGALARAFNRIAWPAFGLTFVTGIWNLMVIAKVQHPWFEIKFLFVLLSAGGAVIHILGKSKAALAIGGALSGFGAIASMYLGLML